MQSKLNMQSITIDMLSHKEFLDGDSYHPSTNCKAKDLNETDLPMQEMSRTRSNWQTPSRRASHTAYPIIKDKTIVRNSQF